MNMLRLAGPSDLDRILPMVEAFHALVNVSLLPEVRRDAVETLISNKGLGCIYLIGPQQAPVGYMAITFGFSLEMGGKDAFVDELFIRERVRGKGLGSQVMATLPQLMREHDLVAVHLEVSQENGPARALYRRAHFEPRDSYSLMTLRV